MIARFLKVGYMEVDFLHKKKSVYIQVMNKILYINWINHSYCIWYKVFIKVKDILFLK